MNINDLKNRLRRDRPMKTITVRIPEDVLEDLKRMAPRLGFSGYQPLMRAYIGQGLRADLARFEEDASEMSRVLDGLRRHGVDDEVIASVVAEAKDATRYVATAAPPSA
ncbi:hypothetical protein [Candidatus Amarolinea aalborgensis]|jgi:hypothetical protein|uniref:hypothetical protein n=1 Tax=Candidatus Amarolinea aalborgensis TaxID=2249329 RepID=UPI003BF96897